LTRDSNTVFIQSAEINKFAGDIARHFDSLDPGFLTHPLLSSLIGGFVDLLPGRQTVRLWKIDVHAIRIVARSGEAGNPAPEGIHRDGQDFVAMVLIARSPDAEGGESRIYAQDRRCLWKHTLRHPLEAIVVDDRRVLHGVSLVKPGGEASSVSRDMLFLNFNAKATSAFQETSDAS
jgi:hypothetical protein